MAARPRAATPPKPAPPWPDTTTRLESVEKTQHLMMDKLDDITATLRSLALRDVEMDDRFTRFTAEQRKGVDALAETIRLQQATFNEALGREAEARNEQARQFKEALAEQEKRALDAWRNAVMKGIGGEVMTWLKTITMGGVLALASYYWTRLKG